MYCIVWLRIEKGAAMHKRLNEKPCNEAWLWSGRIVLQLPLRK
jgi:hypothetical protein